MPIQRPQKTARRLKHCRCGKVFAVDRSAAERNSRQADEWHHFDLPVDYYVCSYGSWHWTQQVPGLVRPLCRASGVPDDVIAWMKGENS